MVVNGKAIVDKLFQHTAARRRLDIEADQDGNFDLFQHTAARRRLGATKLSLTYTNDVSTHSRPKAAGLFGVSRKKFLRCFNTQPPEGGWYEYLLEIMSDKVFQHTAARRRLVNHKWEYVSLASRFNTQPPEGGWSWHK